MGAVSDRVRVGMRGSGCNEESEELELVGEMKSGNNA